MSLYDLKTMVEYKIKGTGYRFYSGQNNTIK
jgi:hypothetical protein